MHAFFIAAFYVFIAEMGDKTQLVALAFAARYRAALVLSAVFTATLLIHLFSVGLGRLLSDTLPHGWIRLLAGLAFIGFGIWTLRGDELGEEKKREHAWGPFFTVAVTFFLAELGDKTMLATVAIASQERSFIGVWLGSTVGMVTADGLAVVVGHGLGKRLPEKMIQRVAAALFFISGLWLMFNR